MDAQSESGGGRFTEAKEPSKDRDAELPRNLTAILCYHRPILTQQRGIHLGMSAKGRGFNVGLMAG